MKTATMAQPRRKTPGKLFYRIQEVSRMTGLKPYVLRYWESEFSELRPAKDNSDQRRYRKEDIEVVRAIRKLLYEDRFTIEGARRRLRDELRRIRGEETDLNALQPDLMAELPPASAEQSAQRLNSSLKRLRSEVNDLLLMLSR